MTIPFLKIISECILPSLRDGVQDFESISADTGMIITTSRCAQTYELELYDQTIKHLMNICKVRTVALSASS